MARTSRSNSNTALRRELPCGRAHSFRTRVLWVISASRLNFLICTPPPGSGWPRSFQIFHLRDDQLAVDQPRGPQRAIPRGLAREPGCEPRAEPVEDGEVRFVDTVHVAGDRVRNDVRAVVVANIE